MAPPVAVPPQTHSANCLDIYGLWACSALAVGGGALSMFLPVSLASRFDGPLSSLPTLKPAVPLVFMSSSINPCLGSTHTHMRVFTSNLRFIIFGCVAAESCLQHIKKRRKPKRGTLNIKSSTWGYLVFTKVYYC